MTETENTVRYFFYDIELLKFSMYKKNDDAMKNCEKERWKCLHPNLNKSIRWVLEVIDWWNFFTDQKIQMVNYFV